METAIQIFAALGPVALTAMGLIMSVRPPKATGRAHWLWLVGFLLIGGATAYSTFIELRGTDTLLVKIWEHVADTKPPTKEGARFVLSAGELNRETKTINITALNKGDVIARAGSIGKDNIVYIDHVMTEKDEDEWFKKTENIVAPGGTGIEFLKEEGRTMILSLPNLTDSQLDAVLHKDAYIYVFFLMSFTDETAPPGKKFIASLCVRYHGSLNITKICLAHNETRLLR